MVTVWRYMINLSTCKRTKWKPNRFWYADFTFTPTLPPLACDEQLGAVKHRRGWFNATGLDAHTHTHTLCVHHHPGTWHKPSFLTLYTCGFVCLETVVVQRRVKRDDFTPEYSKTFFACKNTLYCISKTVTSESCPCFTASCITARWLLFVLPYIVFFVQSLWS